MDKLRKYFTFLPLIIGALGAREMIGRQFWFDESLTLLNFALLPAEKIYTSYVIPNNHIGYTLLLRWHYLMMPDGAAPDLWCRLLSLGIAFAFLLFSYWSIKKTAYRILLCSFAATLPFAIYATSVRGYVTALLFAALTLHTACRFCCRGTIVSGILYFFSSLCCVAVLPSDILVCAAIVAYALPLCGKKFYRNRRFYILALIPVAAFAIFWLPIYPQLYAASQLGEGWKSPWRVLGAVSATFGAICFIPAICSLTAMLIRKNPKITDMRLMAFAVIVPLLFFAKAAPFPRVFFPFLGVFLAVIAQYFQHFLALVRKKIPSGYKTALIIIAVSSIGVSGLLSWSPACRQFLNRINGGKEDDYFTPWYVEKTHDPKAAAAAVAKLDYPLCYMSFSSDPWSVMFYGAFAGADMNKFAFDGPRGKISALPDNSVVIINAAESEKDIEERFQGSCIKLWQSSHHKILRFRTRNLLM